MPSDPDSQRTTTPRHGDTSVDLAEIQRLDAVIRRLTRQRDELADLVRVAVGRMSDHRPEESLDEAAALVIDSLGAILRGER